jgi:hypothetical protein
LIAVGFEALVALMSAPLSSSRIAVQATAAAIPIVPPVERRNSKFELELELELELRDSPLGVTVEQGAIAIRHRTSRYALFPQCDAEGCDEAWRHLRPSKKEPVPEPVGRARGTLPALSDWSLTLACVLAAGVEFRDTPEEMVGG